MENDLEKLFDNDLTPPTPKEEIIIDGVDVAGCEYYKGKCMEYTHYCQIGCKECTDIGTKLCHYKQTERFKAKIARLEQENKILREKFIILSEKRGNLVVNNNTLKEQITKLKERNLNIRRHKNLLLESNDKLMRENSKYRIALEEIKETADRTDSQHPESVANLVSVVRTLTTAVLKERK